MDVSRIIKEEGMSTLIEVLFQKGLTQMETVKLILENTDLRLKEVNEAVQCHDAWKDYKKGNNAIKDIFFNESGDKKA